MGLLEKINPELAAERQRQRTDDLTNGRVRIGGRWWWMPNRESYLTAAGVLLEHGRAKGDLDSLAIPMLYLQRHTLELVLKHLLEMVVDVAKYRETQHPSLARVAAFHVWGHKLNVLLDMLHDGLRAHSALGIEYPPLPDDLERLVSEFGDLEDRDETRLRYDYVRSGQSFPQQKVVLAGQFQARLVAIAEQLFEDRKNGFAEALYNDLVGLDSEVT